jgi:hypothetical protein
VSEPGFDAAAEQRIRDLLAASPRPPIPPEVHQQISAAIASESEDRATGAAPATPIRTRRSWVVPTVAAAAVVLLAGVIVAPMVRSGSQEPAANVAAAPGECGVTANTSADLSPVMMDSGSDYSTSGFTTQTAALLSRAPKCADQVAVAPGTDPGTPLEGGVTDPSSGVGARSASPESDSVTTCLMAVIPGRVVVAVDRGRFAGTDVVVAVVSEPTHALAIDCSAHPARVLYQTDL